MTDYAENVTYDLVDKNPAQWRRALDGDMRSIKALMVLAVREGYALGLQVKP